MARIHVFAAEAPASLDCAASAAGLRGTQIIGALQAGGHEVSVSIPAEAAPSRDAPGHPLRHDRRSYLDLLHRLRPDVVVWMDPLIRNTPFGAGALHICDLYGLGTPAGELRGTIARHVAGAGLVLMPNHWRLAAGVPYAGLGAVALVWLRADPVAGRGNVIFLVLAVWASDIGAYAAGRLLGGPKLAPLISPGKTWSGAAGGLVAAMLVGLAAGQVIAPGAAVRAAFLAALIGAASQGGDLLESALKRGFGVKDSGQLIPGHGGLMDRLDGLLAAAPVAAGLALLIGRGTTLWH